MPQLFIPRPVTAERSRRPVLSFVLAVGLACGSTAALGAPAPASPAAPAQRKVGVVVTNAVVAKPGTVAKPGAPAKIAGTNSVTAKRATTNSFSLKAGEVWQRVQSNRWFYPVVGLIIAGLAALVLARATKGRKSKTGAAAVAPARASAVGRRKPGKPVNVHSCNVLQVSEQEKSIWHFGAHGGGFELSRQQTVTGSESLPGRLVGKDWRSLYQRKLNVAWLPPEQVFVRVVQLPASEFNETLSMVELQLEKYSPMPVAQIVWSFYCLPHARGNMQTVIVLIVSRAVVEEFLGKLEGQGFLADRLEMPMLDQILASPITGDGAWIYPASKDGKGMALVAWWYDGVLRNLDLVTFPAGDPAAGLREQLSQMTWSGELDGWLTRTPQWRLVAGAEAAARWEPALRAGLDLPVEVVEPVEAAELAAMTARRAAQAGIEGNLMPAEFSTHYHQQFVDRLWMRGLGAVVGLYLVGIAVYFVALGFATYRTSGVEQEVAQMGPTYTNAIQLRDRLKVLQDRDDLKYAGLDCWSVTARLLPEGVTLDSFSFSDGRRLTLSGTAPADSVQQLLNFEAEMRKATNHNQLLFKPLAGDNLSYRANPGAAVVGWNFGLELQRAEN